MTAREKFAAAARRQSFHRRAVAALPRLRVYIAGPISGIDDDNRPAFEEARRHVESIACFRAIVPHDLYRPTAEERQCPALIWCRAMCACLPHLERAQYVYMLDGWERSRGARRELARAREMGKVVVFAVGARVA